MLIASESCRLSSARTRPTERPSSSLHQSLGCDPFTSVSNDPAPPFFGGQDLYARGILRARDPRSHMQVQGVTPAALMRTLSKVDEHVHSLGPGAYRTATSSQPCQQRLLLMLMNGRGARRLRKAAQAEFSFEDQYCAIDLIEFERATPSRLKRLACLSEIDRVICDHCRPQLKRRRARWPMSQSSTWIGRLGYPRILLHQLPTIDPISNTSTPRSWIESSGQAESPRR